MPNGVLKVEIIKANNLSTVASVVSDKEYNLTPIIHNELVVRDKLLKHVCKC